MREPEVPAASSQPRPAATACTEAGPGAPASSVPAWQRAPAIFTFCTRLNVSGTANDRDFKLCTTVSQSVSLWMTFNPRTGRGNGYEMVSQSVSLWITFNPRIKRSHSYEMVSQSVSLSVTFNPGTGRGNGHTITY